MIIRWLSNAKSSLQLRWRDLQSLLLLLLFWCMAMPSGFAGSCESPPKRVYLVRHAHKASQEGPLSKKGWEMADRLRDDRRLQKVTQIYVTEKIRTQQTALALAKKLVLVPVTVPFKDTALQKEIICNQDPSAEILIIGHSNKIPEILQTLGMPEVTPDYCDLIVLDSCHFPPPSGRRPEEKTYCSYP